MSANTCTGMLQSLWFAGAYSLFVVLCSSLNFILFAATLTVMPFRSY